MANIVVSAVSTFDNKGLKKGQKEISAFDKSVKSLGKTFAATFGTAALINYGKKAVNAFMADEKAAKSLEVQLKNTGYAFVAPGVELYIANLQKMTGVLDDQLRPALQTLLTASGSLIQSQKALAIALDVSAATGKSVEEVSAAMAKGFSGQTTALTRLGAGLNKTTLASGDMNKILDELSAKFSGQAKARLETYAGKMDLLQVASANVAETIGKSILDSLSMLAKDKSLEKVTVKMEDFGTAIADAILGMGVLLSKLKSLDEQTGANKLYPVLGTLLSASGLGYLSSLGKTERQKNMGTAKRSYQGGQTSNDLYVLKKKEADAIKKTNAARAAELAALNKKSEIDKLKEKFDVDRIGLNAALANATDDETKLRLKAQLAILDNNEILAKKYNAELDGIIAINEFTKALVDASNAIGNIDYTVPIGSPKIPTTPLSYMDPLLNSPSNNPIGNIDYTVPISSGVPAYGANYTPTPMSYNDVRITVDTATNADEWSQFVAKSLLVSQKNGYSQNVAGNS